MLQILDLLAATSLYLSLIYLGIMDKNQRSVPSIWVSLLLALGAILTVVRLVMGDMKVVMVVEVSLFLTGIIAATMLFLMCFTNMIGVGDILVVLSSTFVMPYVPLGRWASVFPAITPISTLLASVIMMIIMRRSTIVMESFPPGFKRVCVRKAGELKARRVVTEYPIYVEGMGFVYNSIFSGSPADNAVKLLQSLPDDAVVYTTPNFPFVFYYAASYGAVSLAVILLGFLEVIGVIA